MSDDGPGLSRLVSGARSVALVTGGFYAVGLAALGVIWILGTTNPQGFGWSTNMDAADPPGWVSLIGLVPLVLGLGLLAVLVWAGEGGRAGRGAAVAALVVVIGIVGLFSFATSAGRACSIDVYTSTRTCIDQTTAFVRDWGLLAIPAVVAIVSLFFATPRPSVSPRTGR
ncbi:MAG TPA: hypothetical protein VIY72_07705 [Acidimicrobiales bacterium]